MSDKFTWKGEVKFVGTAAEFNKFSEMIEKMPVEVSIEEWRRIPNHLAGCFPLPLDSLLTKEQIKKIVDNMPEIKIKYIRDIRGGIRTAHLHLADQVILLDRERFKTMVKSVAAELAERRAERMTDYVDVMGTVNNIGRFEMSPLSD